MNVFFIIALIGCMGSAMLGVLYERDVWCSRAYNLRIDYDKCMELGK